MKTFVALLLLLLLLPLPLCEGVRTDPGRDWPEDASHGNGGYFCRCVGCGETFRGYKRRVRCRKCSATSPRDGTEET